MFRIVNLCALLVFGWLVIFQLSFTPFTIFLVPAVNDYLFLLKRNVQATSHAYQQSNFEFIHIDVY